MFNVTTQNSLSTDEQSRNNNANKQELGHHRQSASNYRYDAMPYNSLFEFIQKNKTIHH